MVADGLLTRQRYREVPPRVDYELTERSRELAPVIGALARWGYDWTWSAPREGEEINIGAIFRTAPGLLEPPALGCAAPSSSSSRATAACDARTSSRRRRGDASPSSRSTATGRDASAAPSPRGSRRSAPTGDRSGLDVSGDRGLADGVLDGFTAAAASARRA